MHKCRCFLCLYRVQRNSGGLSSPISVNVDQSRPLSALVQLVGTQLDVKNPRAFYTADGREVKTSQELQPCFLYILLQHRHSFKSFTPRPMESAWMYVYNLYNIMLAMHPFSIWPISRRIKYILCFLANRF